MLAELFKNIKKFSQHGIVAKQLEMVTSLVSDRFLQMTKLLVF